MPCRCSCLLVCRNLLGSTQPRSAEACCSAPCLIAVWCNGAVKALKAARTPSASGKQQPPCASACSSTQSLALARPAAYLLLAELPQGLIAPLQSGNISAYCLTAATSTHGCQVSTTAHLQRHGPSLSRQLSDRGPSASNYSKVAVGAHIGVDLYLLHVRLDLCIAEQVAGLHATRCLRVRGENRVQLLC